jgi:uncharacterized RDD family membrane protein YckC
VKCPKCHYLGFETGDRCKNCGYDFSLFSAAESVPADYEIHPAAVDDLPVRVVEHGAPENDPWLGTDEEQVSAPDESLLALYPEPSPEDEPRMELATRLDLPLTAPAPAPLAAQTFADTPVEMSPQPNPIAPFLASMSIKAPAASGDRVLPLFKRASEDDEPLIKMPAVPRPPLAVRRTPDLPRLRAVPRPVARPAQTPAPAPALQFAEEAVQRPKTPSGTRVVETIHPVARIAALVIDTLILFGIDAAVVYFTVRMAGLSMQEWTSLPVVPMTTFLGLLTLSYLGAFTAVGGQTIGKMALGTCVVDDQGKPLDPDRALRRTSATLLSLMLFGLGFVPALFGDRRALHDRLAGTRVVRLRSV